MAFRVHCFWGCCAGFSALAVTGGFWYPSVKVHSSTAGSRPVAGRTSGAAWGRRKEREVKWGWGLQMAWQVAASASGDGFSYLFILPPLKPTQQQTWRATCWWKVAWILSSVGRWVSKDASFHFVMPALYTQSTEIEKKSSSYEGGACDALQASNRRIGGCLPSTKTGRWSTQVGIVHPASICPGSCHTTARLRNSSWSCWWSYVRLVTWKGGALPVLWPTLPIQGMFWVPHFKTECRKLLHMEAPC